jgi:DNA-binding NarL/FixJ family response regulator
MLTAFDDEQFVSRAIDAGVYGYLVKPFREQDVVPALRTAQARHAELPERKPTSTPVVVELPSAAGAAWPLAFHRDPDGPLRVSVREES